jgi:hypothetical protein
MLLVSMGSDWLLKGLDSDTRILYDSLAVRRAKCEGGLNP